MNDAWSIVGWVLPNEDMTPYLCDPTHIYRIIVPIRGNPDAGQVHHLPLGSGAPQGMLVSRPATLPTPVPGEVRDRPCSLLWADEWNKRKRRRRP